MEDDKRKQNLKIYARLSSAVIQMGVVIGALAWLGNFLDKKFKNEPAILTIILSLLGVAIGLYLLFREVKKMDNG